MLSTIISWITENIVPLLPLIIGAGGAGAILNVLLKKFLTEKVWEQWRKNLYYWIEKIVRPFFHGVGVLITIGLSKWKYTKKIWNVSLEPVVFTILDFIAGGLIAIVKAIAGGLKDGMTTDNDSFIPEDPA